MDLRGIGEAFVSLRVKDDGFEEDLGKKTEKAGKIASSRLGKTLGVGMKVAGAAAGTAVAGAFSLSMAKGFQRLVAIDNAENKLKGLGHSAQGVETIMKSALESVKGTAFGMGDAANQAANMVAAGIEPGEKLTRTLKILGDSAAIAGIPMGDMGQIFTKVAGSGKVTGEVMVQLGERGIPILQMLAKHYKVSTAEAGAMVSSGKVKFEDFQTAIESSIGGAALAMGGTFTGAVANLNSAFGRLGANVLQSAFKQLIPIIGTATTMVDKLGPASKAAGKMFGDSFAGVVSTGKKIAGVGAEIFAGFKFDIKAIGADKQFSSLEKFGMAARKVLDRGLYEGGALLAPFKKEFEKLGPTMGPFLKEMGGMFGPLLKELGPAVMSIWQSFSPLSLVFKSLAPILPQIVGSFQSLALSIGKGLSSTLAAVLPALANLGKIFSSVVVPILTKLISDILPLAVKLWETFSTQLFGIVGHILPLLVEAFTSLMEPLGQLVSELFPVLLEVLKPIIEVVMGIVSALAPVI